MNELIQSLYRRLPPAPPDLRASFRDATPFLAGLSAVLTVLGGLGVGFRLEPLFLLLLLPALLSLAAIPGLRSRNATGWWLFFTALLIDFVVALVSGNLLSVLFNAIFLYLLVQVHEYYWQRPRRYL